MNNFWSKWVDIDFRITSNSYTECILVFNNDEAAHRCCINLQKWEDIVLFAVENFDGKITFCLQESEGNKISNEIQKSDIIKHVLKIFEESTNINGFKILFGVLEEGVSSSLSSLHPSHFSDNLTSPDLLYYKVLENCILSGSEFQCHVDLHDL